MARLGLISDTHLRRSTHLPDFLVESLRGVDAILHAGDVVDVDCLEPLASLAPLYLVSGNSDPPEVGMRFGWRRALRWRGWRMGLVHGDAGRSHHTPRNARNAFRHEPPAWEEIPVGSAPPPDLPCSHVPVPPGLPHRGGLVAPTREEFDCIVFGHSHAPFCEFMDGVLMINPGSPTDRRRQPRASFALLQDGDQGGLEVSFSYL